MYLAIKPIFLTSQAPSLADQFLQTIARARPFCFHRVLIKLVEINLTSGPKIGEYYTEPMSPTLMSLTGVTRLMHTMNKIMV
jgi:hypothetical protein